MEKLSCVFTIFFAFNIINCISQTSPLDPDQEPCGFRCRRRPLCTAATTTWSYDSHGGDWSTIGSCGNTLRQSPIDISSTLYTSVTTASTGLTYFYPTLATAVKVYNAGKNIEVASLNEESAPLGWLKFNGHLYLAKQFHFHAHSEHRWDGVYRKLEAHIVHTSTLYGTQRLAVLAVGFDEGGPFSQHPTLTSIGGVSGNLLPASGQSYNIQADASKLVPTKGTFTHYPGSLTTPPCSEIVDWFVLDTPLIGSSTQLNRFASLLKYDKAVDYEDGNWRNTDGDTQNQMVKDYGLIKLEGIALPSLNALS